MAALHSKQSHGSPTRVRTMPPAVEAWSLNPWAIGEAPVKHNFKTYFLLYLFISCFY